MRKVLLVGAVLSAALVGASAQVGSLINYGAIIKDSVRLENAGAFLRLPADGSVRWGDPESPINLPLIAPHVGTLQVGTLNQDRTWILPDETGTLLTSATTFGAAGASDATVSGTYNALDIQLKAGVVGTTELAANAVATGNIQNNAVTYAKLQNAGGPNRLLVSGTGGAWGELAPGTTGHVL
ncbi:MAG: hypothetical protein RMK00_09520, partial [Bacteroidota bacterium]|nr:hypothetical protein [Bacteroidota bacterium]